MTVARKPPARKPVPKSAPVKAPVAPKSVVPEATADLAEALLIAVDALRSASIEVHNKSHDGAYGTCHDAVCAKANFLWEYSGGTKAAKVLMPSAEAWLARKVSAVVSTPPPPEVSEFRKSGQPFTGEVAPGAPPLVIADVSESRRDMEDPGIPKDWEKLDPAKAARLRAGQDG